MFIGIMSQLNCLYSIPGRSQSGNTRIIYLFQSYLADITGMDYCNASMYDGATAFAEAISMAYRLNKKRKIYLYGDFHPEYIEVLNSYSKPLEITYTQIDSLDDLEEKSCLVVQNPNFFGEQLNETERTALKAKVKDLDLF